MTTKQEIHKRRELWIKALESGKYRQSNDQLGGHIIGYCCLGVACAVYEKETGEVLPKTREGTYTDTTLSGKLDFVKVAEWYNIRGVIVNQQMSEGESKKRSLQAYLMDLNDQEEKTFSEIAQYLKTAFIELDNKNEKTN